MGAYLFVGLLQVFHQDGDDHVDQDELGHQNEYDKKDGSDDTRDAAVFDTISRCVAILTQRVLHDAVPVISGSYAEQRQKGDAEIGKMRVLAQTLTRMFVVAFLEQKNPKRYTKGKKEKVGKINE